MAHLGSCMNLKAVPSRAFTLVPLRLVGFIRHAEYEIKIFFAFMQSSAGRGQRPVARESSFSPTQIYGEYFI